MRLTRYKAGHCLLAVFFTFLALSAVLVSPVAHAQTNGEATLQPNMDNVDLEDFIRFFGRYTGKNLVYRSDQIPKVKFNIYSREAISEPQLWAIFNDVLKSVGINAVQKGELLYIVPTNVAQQMDHDFKPEKSVLKAPNNELATTVYQLASDVPSKLAAQFLQGLVSPMGLVQEIPQARAVLIRETPERIRKMLDILSTIQGMRPHMDVEVIRIENAQAENVATMVKSLYEELTKRGLKAEAPFVLAVPWSNAVLFAGTSEQKDEVLRLVREVDQVQEPETGIRVYRLQNAKAEEVAKVLEALVVVQQGDQKTTVKNDFKASADEGTNSLLVIGNKDIFPQVEEMVSKLDLPQDQVFIEALIMETSLTDSKQFGVEWMALGSNNELQGSVGYLNADGSSLLSYADPVIGTSVDSPDFPAVSAMPGGFSMGILGNIITYGGKRYPTIGALVNFLKTASEINILSTPQIMTLDNSEAEVFVGENRPFLTTTKYDSNNNPVQSYDYRDVGFKLVVTPHINSESGLVRLEIFQEVKQVTVAAEAPTTLTRTTKTAIQLLDGSTVVISGLVRDDLDRSKTGIPGLADIPGLGWLFRKESTGGTKATLMVFISARIIRTLDSANQLTREKMQVLQQTKKDVVKSFKDVYTFDGFGAIPSEPAPAAQDQAPAQEGAAPAVPGASAVPEAATPQAAPSPLPPASVQGIQTKGEIQAND